MDLAFGIRNLRLDGQLVVAVSAEQQVSRAEEEDGTGIGEGATTCLVHLRSLLFEVVERNAIDPHDSLRADHVHVQAYRLRGRISHRRCGYQKRDSQHHDRTYRAHFRSPG